MAQEERLGIPDAFHGRRKELACVSGQEGEGRGTGGPVGMWVQGKMCGFALQKKKHKRRNTKQNKSRQEIK